jgi:hypothetical protein
LETGIEQAVVDAQNAVASVRFKHAPSFEAALQAEAEKLAADRSKLEQALTALASREEDVRAGWRTIAAAVPGASTDLVFEDGATTPERRPSEPHPGIAAFVRDPSWPSWFRAAVRQAAIDYGSAEQMRAHGIDPERDRLRHEAISPIGAA